MASLGNLVAGVAHEINNPIGFLNGSIRNGKDYVQDLFEHLETYQEQHFKKARRWHNGVEGCISFLKRCFGLQRCLYKGESGFSRWVGLGIIAHNLTIISRVTTKISINQNLNK